jgi:hypothetical protein
MSDQERTGPADDASVPQEPGAAAPAPGTEGAAESGGEREFGMRGAVERGPAELSDEGEPVRDRPHAALDDVDPARSTDDL